MIAASEIYCAGTRHSFSLARLRPSTRAPARHPLDHDVMTEQERSTLTTESSGPYYYPLLSWTIKRRAGPAHRRPGTG